MLTQGIIMITQLISAPASDTSSVYEQLGYLQARDAVLHCDYAFCAYKETERSSGEWRVRIKSSQTAGAVFERKMIEDKALIASDEGKPFFMWGYNFEPSSGDPRLIEFRVHVKDGKPTEIEMVAQLRKNDHTPGELKSVRFAWPK
jgi:hypothetical protein